jgi:hypothetical protein
VWVLAYTEDLSLIALSLVETLRKLIGSCPVKTVRKVCSSLCRSHRFSFSESNPVTYQTGS